MYKQKVKILMKVIKFLRFVSVSFSVLLFGALAGADAKCENGNPTLQEVYGAGGDICMSLSAGGAGGSYVGVFGEGFSTYMDDYGFGFYEVQYSKGSFENLVNIAKGSSVFGLAQKDVQLFLEFKFDGTIPEGELSLDDQGEDVEEIESFKFKDVRFVTELVDECVYVAYNKKKSVNTMSDLQKEYSDPNKRPNINIGSKGSGSFYTWSFITSLNPHYGFADKEESKFYGMGKKLQEFDKAYADLKDPKSKMEALIWVADPSNLENSKLLQVMEDSDLDLMDFGDSQLAQKLTPELLKRDPKDILKSVKPSVSDTVSPPTVDAQDLLAQTLSQFNSTPVQTADTDEPFVNRDTSAYHLRNVNVSKQSPKQVQTVCTRAALYAHKNLLDPEIKVDEFNTYFTEGGENAGVLWGEMLGLIQEHWGEIVSSN